MLFSYIYQDERKLLVLLKDVMKFCTYDEKSMVNSLQSNMKSDFMLLTFYKIIPYQILNFKTHRALYNLMA